MLAGLVSFVVFHPVAAAIAAAVALAIGIAVVVLLASRSTGPGSATRRL